MARKARKITIIGGGASGVLTAAQLLRLAKRPLEIFLIERGPHLGRGAAYGTPDPGHLLNVRAQGMSAFADSPSHWVEWASQTLKREVNPNEFLSRELYGRYLKNVLEESKLAAAPGVYLEWIRDEAISCVPHEGGYTMGLSTGRTLPSHAVVMAMGNLPPAHVGSAFQALESHPRYISNFWSEGGIRALNSDAEVLVIGAGLTMADVAVSLQGMSFRGTLHCLSRRGFMPQVHRSVTPKVPRELEACAQMGLRSILRSVRHYLETHPGSDWREVIDGLRPQLPAIWQSFDLREKQRFLRHLRPFWEVHRHRMAPEVHALLTDWIKIGRLIQRSGRVVDVAASKDRIRVRYRRRVSQELEEIGADWVINCTGPECDFRNSQHGLLRQLQIDRVIEPDDLNMGVASHPDGLVKSPHGGYQENLFTIGPLRKGTLWETTAIPEIRVQAQQLALTLLGNLGLH